ncbi:MAG: 16S rRNA (cytidine(1402)-2'-O)-methyltransferase [Oscillospiraceae bacterium]|nr:16S rRNA (cytidine(1402)-2'-O)-methyltransferase [Oscillospiraceae bacterium]
MSGTLYLVGTPIGNLNDISPRCEQVLSEVDFIAAEDTRVSIKILNHLGIKKQLVSYYEHNQAESGPKIVQRLMCGEDCALVTDAGMPAISDPGEGLVDLCVKSGIRVVCIPGPCAAVSALALSGLPTGRFTFEGFLSANKKQRAEQLDELKAEKRTMIFYEAPHKLKTTLKDMLTVWGDREISISRELTKLHEETVRTTLSAACEYYAENEPKGEFVLVIKGAEIAEHVISMEEALELVRSLQDEGKSLKDAVKRVASDHGLSKNELYDMAIKG